MSGIALIPTKKHAPAKRVRPDDGGIEWHEELHAFFCRGCLEYDEIRNPHSREPDKLAEIHEGLIMDHTECWEFDDPEMAKQARKHRKEKKRRELLAAGGLAAQRVSWRGR
jgi:hypothetical protein